VFGIVTKRFGLARRRYGACAKGVMGKDDTPSKVVVSYDI
jgi:hypothetical protein